MAAEQTWADERAPEPARTKRAYQKRTKTDRPPQYTPTGDDANGASDTPKPKRDVFRDECIALYTTVGTLAFFASPMDGTTIIAHAEKRGGELAAYAKHHPRVKAAVRSLSSGSDTSALLMGNAMLALAILQNHPATQTALLEAVKRPIDRLLRRPKKDAPAPAPNPTTPYGMEPPEARVVDGPLPTFYAAPHEDMTPMEPLTSYDGFDAIPLDQAAMAQRVAMATR